MRYVVYAALSALVVGVMATAEGATPVQLWVVQHLTVISVLLIGILLKLDSKGPTP